MTHRISRWPERGRPGIARASETPLELHLFTVQRFARAPG
jgi:hypothetical protein